MSKTASNETKPTEEVEEKSFIVQNITPGFHCVSDLKLEFAPYEVKDLTFEDANIVKRSSGLRNSLMKGFLKRITQREWNEISNKEFIREKNAILADKKAKNQKIFDINGREVQADVVNLTTGAANMKAEVKTAGYLNDPQTYALVFSEANQRSIAAGNGPLDAEEFASRILKGGNKPVNFDNMIDKQQGVTSGDPGKRKATVITAPINADSDTSTASFDMSNYNRDHFIAGSEGISYLENDTPEIEDVAESIDLTEDLTEDSGGIRRK